MKLKITGINIELTPEIRELIKLKLEKLNRHSLNVIGTKVEIAEEKTKSPEQRYLVRTTVDAGGNGFHAEVRAKDLRTAIDKLISTLTRQMNEHRRKMQEKTRNVPTKEDYTAPKEQEITTREIVKVKKFAIKPMDVPEAAQQMELLNHDFYLFLNAENEQVNLLYRRNDGNYGLIEPELG